MEDRSGQKLKTAVKTEGEGTNQPPPIKPLQKQGSSPRKKSLGKKIILVLGAFLVATAAAYTFWAYQNNKFPFKEEPITIPPGEFTALKITSVEAKNITETGATITWSTDIPATSQVMYGKTATCTLQTEESTTLTTSHSVKLEKLKKATVYYYRVESKDEGGTTVVSKDYSFTTQDPTAGWKTYRNSVFGFSFKYPVTYKVTSEDKIALGEINKGGVTLSDTTRKGKPNLDLWFNFYGGFEPGNPLFCANIINYQTKIQEGGLKITKRTLDPFTEEDEEFYPGEEDVCPKKYLVQFYIGSCVWSEELTADKNCILSFFTYQDSDYEDEIQAIIGTITIEKEGVFGK
jgi:hypothetical protein